VDDETQSVPNVVQSVTSFIDNFDKELRSLLLSGKTFFEISFKEVISYDSSLAEALIQDPASIILLFEDCIKAKMETDFKCGFIHLPKTCVVPINELRMEHLKKLISVEGEVRQTSEVVPKVSSEEYKCEVCGEPVYRRYNVTEEFERKPKRCGCGSTRLSLAKRIYQNVQKLVLEEPIDLVIGDVQPRKLHVLLSRDLTSKEYTEYTHPPSRIVVNGYIQEVPKKFTKLGSSLEQNMIMIANSIEGLKKEIARIKVTDEERKTIKEMSENKNYLADLIESIAPEIYGYDEVKEALLYHMVGGLKVEEAGNKLRVGDIHVLLVSDTAIGKTTLAKSIARKCAKSEYVDCTAASKAGITASAEKDEFLGVWAVKAGAAVRANGGHLILDELDKLPEDVIKSLHIVMSEQIVKKDVASISALMKAECAVLGLMNPKFGRFSTFEPIMKQVELLPTIINRFDLVFPIIDEVREEEDKKIIKKVFDVRKKDVNPPISEELFRKIVFVARQNNPRLSSDAEEAISKYYLEIRKKAKIAGENGNAVPITPRQIESLVKIAQASAKLHHKPWVQKEDAERGIRLMNYFLKKVAMDVQTGTLDIDFIETGMPKKDRNIYIHILQVIKELEKNTGAVAIEEIFNNVPDVTESEIEDAMEKLKRKGDIFEPKRGFWKCI